MPARRITKPSEYTVLMQLRRKATFLFYMFLLIIASVFLVCTAYVHKTHNRWSPPLNKNGYAVLVLDEKIQYWTGRIHASGADKAYAELAIVIEMYPSQYQHDEVHIFGDVLYRTEGLRGISTCDGRFGYACFHSFMIRALAEGGAASSQQLYDICRQTLGASSPECEHGIGHGLLATIKNDATIEDLSVALSACDHLDPPSHPISGCAGGVFMEYLVKSMASGGIDPRILTKDNILEPCGSLRIDGYLSSCMYWLPMWWMLASPERNLDEVMAAKMGGWCVKAPSPDSLTACIKGVANRMQLLTNEQPALTEKICSMVTTDAALRYTCHTHAARRFTYYFSLQDALIACSGLPPKEEASCRIQATEESRLIRADQEKHRAAPDSEHAI